ncbi:nucleotidyltransferase family protein [Halomarina litorea]|uniref:nucleotidyltransferase family protein n=1 Tax=Halomarina litorea TaxID=2961595 RepID=UPI0020C2DBBD|nr:nucleotidyltransferase family protein [Halomarina sp. BCD28]
MDEPIPLVRPAEFPDAAPEEGASVWGVLLAAGTSSRYGDRNKLLERFDGEPLVRRAAESLAAAPLDGVVAVVGHQSSAVRDAVDGVVSDVCANEEYERGQSMSVRTGVEAVRDHGADAVVVALGDMPTVRPATVGLLVDAYERGVGTALAAAYEGRRGNPVLFDARHFDALAAVDGDVGGRGVLLASAGGALVATDDPGVVRDVDAPSDLDALE